MQSSFYRRTMPKLLFAIVALTIGVFVSRGDQNANAAGSYNPTSAVTLSSLVAGANANVTTNLTIVLNDYNFSAVLNGTPADAFVAPGPGNPAFVPGTHPALGDYIGTLSSSSTLGLTGNPCSSAVFPNFTFLNATTNNAVGNTILAVPQSATNPGSGATLDNMWSDDGSSTTGPDADPPWNGPWDAAAATAQGLPASAGLSVAEQTNGLPAQVDRYPAFLNILFDPDYPATPGANAVQPLARYAGATNVVGTSVFLDLVIFGPDVLSSAFPAPHPFNLTAGKGYISVAVLNDSTVEAAHGSISDFCSPLFTNAVIDGVAKANPCNGAAGPPNCDTQTKISNPTPGAATLVRYANPPAGSKSWVTVSQSLRDYDGDGIENSLDACAFDADTYNPRTDTGPDADNDGMPDICDPNDADGNTDHDGDGWENSYDNCPLVSNPLQTDSEANVGTYTTVAPFGGPRGDGIGDACDVSNDSSNIGDGYTDDVEAGTPLCGNGKNDDDKTGAGLVADDAVIDDGCPGGPAQVGAFSEASFKVGTDKNDRCQAGPGAGLPSGAWPSDLYTGGIPDSTNKINITDLTSFIAPPATRKLDTAPGQANFNSRWDLSPGRGVFNNMINVTDLTSLIAANPNGFPPMFSNGTVKAFSGPVCTDPAGSTIANGAFISTTYTDTKTITP